MYITGAIEIMLNYLSPEVALFGDFEADKSILYHNIRVYGTCFLIIIGILVFIGVKFVSKFAPIALFCVLVSILSIYLGIFVNYNGNVLLFPVLLLNFLTIFLSPCCYIFLQESTITESVQSVVEYCPIKIISPVRKRVYASISVTSTAQ